MLGQARQITIQSLHILRQTTDENNRGRLKKINKKAARIAQRIQWGIPESHLMRGLHTKNSPGAAWVLASRLADTLGDLDDWKKEDWDQYINLLKKGLTDSSIPTLNSKYYILGQAFEHSPYGNTGEAIRYYTKAYENDKDLEAMEALGFIFSSEHGEYYDPEKAVFFLSQAGAGGKSDALVQLAHIFIMQSESDENVDDMRD